MHFNLCLACGFTPDTGTLRFERSFLLACMLKNCVIYTEHVAARISTSDCVKPEKQEKLLNFHKNTNLKKKNFAEHPATNWSSLGIFHLFI